MNCQGSRTQTWAAEQLAWNNVDSHWPIRVDWAGGLLVRAHSLRLCQMSKCHFTISFTIIMSCVQSTLRNFGIRYIRFTDKFGFRTNSAFGKIRPSDKLRFRTWTILFYLNQIRNFYYFLVETCFHHNICHHHIHKKFFKIPLLALRGKKYLQNWSLPAT